MTEAEWLTTAEPGPMLDYLQDRGSRRKLILFCLYWCPLYAMERANGDPSYDTAMRFAEVGNNLEELRQVWDVEQPDEVDAKSPPEQPLKWAKLLIDPSLRADLSTPPTDRAPGILRIATGRFLCRWRRFYAAWP
jgi:hypothetical protein